MSQRVFVYMDSREPEHDPALNLGRLAHRHLTEADLQPGDLLITHPVNGALKEDEISMLEVMAIEPVAVFAVHIAPHNLRGTLKPGDYSCDIRALRNATGSGIR